MKINPEHIFGKDSDITDTCIGVIIYQVTGVDVIDISNGWVR